MSQINDELMLKALKYCQDTEGDSCQCCAYQPIPDCNIVLLQDTLSYIERLEKGHVEYVKAVFNEFVERLKNDLSLAQIDDSLLISVVNELVETMKNEFNEFVDLTKLIENKTIKEFTDKLKGEMTGKYCEHFDGELTNVIIDKCMKEMGVE